jgi:hypothetical protein
MSANAHFANAYSSVRETNIPCIGRHIPHTISRVLLSLSIHYLETYNSHSNLVCGVPFHTRED